MDRVHTTRVTDPDAADRLRRRYPPPRVPRAAKIALVAVGVAIALSWLVWAALLHARPAVSAQVLSYTVTSDTTIEVVMTVDRRDASTPVTCRMIAQSADFQTVGEQQVPVPATEARVVNVDVKLTTLRRATAPSVQGCTVD